MLFSEPKIPQCPQTSAGFARGAVSVLFSEPKIPQSERARPQRQPQARFQCSSASRKFLNRRGARRVVASGVGFSALQRAENSSIASTRGVQSRAGAFQCSSASRKFLNSPYANAAGSIRCEVSVLFSEPKIPQLSSESMFTPRIFAGFSALQRAENSSIANFLTVALDVQGFSALQRAENSSMRLSMNFRRLPCQFQCSSASRKFLNT